MLVYQIDAKQIAYNEFHHSFENKALADALCGRVSQLEAASGST